MDSNLLYHLGKIGAGESSTFQSRQIRRIILDDKNDKEKLEAILDLTSTTTNLENDSITLINQAIMPHYGSENQGLGGDDYELKSNFYRRLILRFPNELSFQFKLSECYYIAGNPIEELVAVFFPALKNDVKNQHSVGADVFELIQSSPFAEQLNALLDEKFPEGND